MLGDSQIGKSALVNRFMDRKVFLNDYHETIIDSYKKMMLMLNNKGIRNREVSLNIRDVGAKFIRENMISN